jgi:hypothetical protein
MSSLQISRSRDLKRLRDEGYDIEVKDGGILLMKDVPYVNKDREVKRGVLVSTLRLAGQVTDKPDTHVAYFIGEQPCNPDGSAITQIQHPSAPPSFGSELVAQYTFSAQPRPNGSYLDYYNKMIRYETILSSRARIIDPSVTAKTFPLIPVEAEDSIHCYYDTASSRANIMAAAKKLENQRIAIIGGGGTGSYVLDFAAKTYAREIHLYDDDTFSQHNAFRSPGAATTDELEKKPTKVAYLHAKYSKMHRGVIPHDAPLDERNVHELKGLTFVFLCIDKSEPKRLIVSKLIEYGVPFCDVGMGLSIEDDMLTGVMRVTTVSPDKHDHIERRISFEDTPRGDLYRKNIQVAELNAFNAALAVLKWKKYCGFYRDTKHEYNTTFTVGGNLLVNGEIS